MLKRLVIGKAASGKEMLSLANCSERQLLRLIQGRARGLSGQLSKGISALSDVHRGEPMTIAVDSLVSEGIGGDSKHRNY